MTELTIADRAERLVQTYLKYGRASEESRIREAFAWAEEAHREQFRESGEPYVTHPLSVAARVSFLLPPTSTLATSDTSNAARTGLPFRLDDLILRPELQKYAAPPRTAAAAARITRFLLVISCKPFP